MRSSPQWFVFDFTCSLAMQAATALLWVQRGEQQGFLATEPLSTCSHLAYSWFMAFSCSSSMLVLASIP